MDERITLGSRAVCQKLRRILSRGDGGANSSPRQLRF